MPSERMSDLIEELNRLTAADKLDWAETAEEKSFVASFPKYSVTISEVLASDRWGNEFPSYVLTVMDLNGKVLDSVRDLDYPTNYEVAEGLLQTEMRKLHDRARRKAMKVDEALADLLGSLKKVQ
jgi:hypothetical protein